MKRESTSNADSVSRRIHLLRDIDAQRLAAGEVIERPVSVLRELLDNAIDAGSTAIQIYLRDGGLELIQVIDNGSGMSREDLTLCMLPHTTSKINVIEDLERTTSLGFRGEALSSIAACSRIEVVSNGDEQEGTYRITADNGSITPVEKWRGTGGTSVRVSALFHGMPGRKKFLKRPQTEGVLCKSMVIEKALPFTDIAFKLFMQDEMKLFLPPLSLLERVTGAYPSLFPAGSLFQAEEERKDFSITMICGMPSLFRRDRKYIHIFVNNRKIQEYSLLQAVAYGFSGHLPGGLFPYAFLFIEIDPALVDFNIHPAKKEVRFRNLPEIHHAVTALLRKTLGVRGEPAVDVGESPQLIVPERRPTVPLRRFHEIPSPPADERPYPFTYKGQLFGLFLMAEQGESLFFVDQHAAHERFLYDRFIESTPVVQELLIPLSFELDADLGDVLEEKMETYREMGIGLERTDRLNWSITSVPAQWTDDKDGVIDLLTAAAAGHEDLEVELFARLACKGAIKEGEIVDERTALELISYSISLDTPRCPHGRPLFHILSREDLYRQVERLF